MNYIKEFFLPSVLLLSALFTIYFFRTASLSKLWNGYTVMYASTETEPSYIDSVLEEKGCFNVISLEKQQIPLEIKKESPEFSLAQSSLLKSDYIERRKMYFFDKSNSFRIYYIPNEYQKNASEAAAVIKNQTSCEAGIDITPFPMICPAVCIFFAIILFINTKNKIPFSAGIVLPLYFSFMIPFYSSAAALTLLMYGIFISINFLDRNGALAFLGKNIYISAFFLVPLFIMFFTSAKLGFLFVTMLIGIGAVLYLYNKIKAFHNKRYSFIPSKIRPAFMVPIFTKNSLRLLMICSAVPAIILIFALLSVKLLTFSSLSSINLQLPCSHGISGSLPNIEDFIEWKWEVISFPYISLHNKNTKFCDKFIFKRYSESSGAIQEYSAELNFNDEFKKKTVDLIDTLQYPALEKMLKLQGTDFKAGYVPSQKQDITILTIILLLIALFLPISFYLLLKN